MLLKLPLNEQLLDLDGADDSLVRPEHAPNEAREHVLSGGERLLQVLDSLALLTRRLRALLLLTLELDDLVFDWFDQYGL